MHNLPFCSVECYKSTVSSPRKDLYILSLLYQGVLPPKCVLTILTFKIWDPHTPSTKSSILVLRTVLNVLTLKFSVFPKPPSNITVQSLFKHAPKQLELNNMLQVSSSSIIISLIFLCLHFLIFKCVISSILILKKS